MNIFRSHIEQFLNGSVMADMLQTMFCVCWNIIYVWKSYRREVNMHRIVQVRPCSLGVIKQEKKEVKKIENEK